MAGVRNALELITITVEHKAVRLSYTLHIPRPLIFRLECGFRRKREVPLPSSLDTDAEGTMALLLALSLALALPLECCLLPSAGILRVPSHPTPYSPRRRHHQHYLITQLCADRPGSQSLRAGLQRLRHALLQPQPPAYLVLPLCASTV